ncbi:MAG: preprotein translocase subunit SecE [Gammaproteobacteria bacterium]|jgi:preprotein translocase subunit SecE
MSAKPQEQASAADTVKLVIAVLLLLGGIVAFYYFSAQPLVIRWLALLVVSGLGVVVGLQTALGRRAIVFMKSSNAELRKVVWPSRQETMQTTLAVIAMVVILGIFMWGLDMFLIWATKILTGRGS